MNAEDQNGWEETGGTTDIGAALARRRREKGLSLRDVEHATKIRTRYLEGLEQEDYGVLPDPVYVRGFLKTYANFLGLDGERLSREFKDRRGPRRERFQGNYENFRTSDADQPLIVPGGLGGAERRKVSAATLLTVALAVIVLAAVIGGLYLVGSWSASGPAEAPAVQEEPAEGPSDEPATGSGAAAEEDAAPETMRTTLRVVGSSSTGMTITNDGTVVYSQTAPSGFSETYETEDLLVVEARNGGAVEVEVEGQEAERLGDSGQPITREFTPEG